MTNKDPHLDPLPERARGCAKLSRSGRGIERTCPLYPPPYQRLFLSRTLRFALRAYPFQLWNCGFEALLVRERTEKRVLL
jgi:hypothetical protein